MLCNPAAAVFFSFFKFHISFSSVKLSWAKINGIYHWVFLFVFSLIFFRFDFAPLYEGLSLSLTVCLKDLFENRQKHDFLGHWWSGATKDAIDDANDDTAGDIDDADDNEKDSTDDKNKYDTDDDADN